jgi:glutathione synthase/RimK-type ligase-like ATP-grasp enzyme
MARIARSLGEGYVHAVNTVLESPLQALRGEDPLGIKWVVKSMSSRRSIVVFSDDSRLTPWEQCAGGPPVQRQRYIQGMNVRVHVVGKEVYACSVRSGEVDYRYASASVTFEEIVLPVGVEQWCVDAAASEGLLFAGIDMLEANGEFCCLEINPCPGYEDYEKRAFGGRYLISEAIISLLLDLPSGGSLPTAV